MENQKRIPKNFANSPIIKRRINIYRSIYIYMLSIITIVAILASIAVQIWSMFSGEDFEKKAVDSLFFTKKRDTIATFLLKGAFHTKDNPDQKSIETYKNVDNVSTEFPKYITPSIGDIPVALNQYESQYKNYLRSNVKNLSELYNFDYSIVPSGEKAIVPIDLSRKPANGELYISNETDYSPDLESMLKLAYPIAPINSNMINLNTVQEPIILILHTHGTESYTDEGISSYSEKSVPRSDDVTKNVVAVGTVMKNTLNAAGVPTIHCEIMHDKESYLDSYNRANETILKYMKMYPSIKYVLDVHRDSLVRENGDKVKPVTIANNEVVAQYMSVVGTDFKGANHPYWRDNLTVAVKLQYLLNTTYTNLARPINLRGAGFNEQHTKGSLLLEVGSCGNTLDEAKKTGVIVAESLSKLIKGNVK